MFAWVNSCFTYGEIFSEQCGCRLKGQNKPSENQVFPFRNLIAQATNDLQSRLKQWQCVYVWVWVCVFVCAYSFRHVRLFSTPWTIALQAPLSVGFSRQGYCEWVAISFSSGSSQSRDLTLVSCTAGRFFTDWATRAKEHETNKQKKNQWKETSHLNGIRSLCWQSG